MNMLREKMLTKEEQLKWIGCVNNAELTADGHHCKAMQFELKPRDYSVLTMVNLLNQSLNQPIFRKSPKTGINRITIERKFKSLAQRWREETMFISSLTEIATHPAYQQIVGMGPDIVPLLLRELQTEPDYWFWALAAITRENPVTHRDAGDLGRMTAAWIKWGRQHNYI